MPGSSPLAKLSPADVQQADFPACPVPRSAAGMTLAQPRRLQHKRGHKLLKLCEGPASEPSPRYTKPGAEVITPLLAVKLHLELFHRSHQGLPSSGPHLQQGLQFQGKVPLRNWNRVREKHGRTAIPKSSRGPSASGTPSARIPGYCGPFLWQQPSADGKIPAEPRTTTPSNPCRHAGGLHVLVARRRRTESSARTAQTE